MRFSEAIIPLVSILTVISSLLIHWNNLNAASKRWRFILLCVLVVAAIVVTVSCVGYEVNQRSAEQEPLANGARFEPVAGEELDEPVLSVSQTPILEVEGSPSASSSADKGWRSLTELKETRFNEYGYQWMEARIFFVSELPEVKYAEPINQISKSEIGLIHQGYDIWVKYSYRFGAIAKEELDAIRVDYVLFMPNNEYRVYPGGALGDGSKIEYDQGVMPSASSFFEDYLSWPSGRYSLCLLLNGTYAGEARFEILDN